MKRWSSLEDDLIRAGVCKYGENHWPKISTLLRSRSPAECKARWAEYLDPSPIQGPFSAEEDSQLLLLARAYPSQWGTVGRILGRRGHACRRRVLELEGKSEGPARPESLEAVAAEMHEEDRDMAEEAAARLASNKRRKDRKKSAIC